MIATAILLGACSESVQRSELPASTGAAAATTVPTTTVATTTGATTTVATTTSVAPTPSAPETTVASTATTVTAPGPLEFVDGAFLGIRQGSLLTDAASALEAVPVRLSDFDSAGFACTGTENPWLIRSGGLTLVFEEPPMMSDGQPESPAILTNWRYIGGPVAGYTELIAPNGIRIGDTRDALVAASPNFTDLGTEIDVLTPVFLRFGFDSETVSNFGIVDCLFEGEPPTD